MTERTLRRCHNVFWKVGTSRGLNVDRFSDEQQSFSGITGKSVQEVVATSILRPSYKNEPT
jgi:hypothetical protein